MTVAPKEKRIDWKTNTIFDSPFSKMSLYAIIPSPATYPRAASQECICPYANICTHERKVIKYPKGHAFRYNSSHKSCLVWVFVFTYIECLETRWSSHEIQNSWPKKKKKKQLIFLLSNERNKNSRNQMCRLHYRLTMSWKCWNTVTN